MKPIDDPFTALWNARRVGLAVVLTLTLFAGTAAAVPFTKDAKCNGEKCGTMTIDTYKTVTGNAAAAKEFWLGGVEINGKFEATKKLRYQYVQAIKTESDTFRWINDTSVPYPQPFVDVPPGGHKARDGAGSPTFKDQEFDYLPWYDGTPKPPPFYDRPVDYMLPAKTDADKKLEWAFETWLVCVLEAVHDDDKQAKDDSYKIAPILGWQWGYDLLYKDVGVIGTDEFADFTPTARKFDFLEKPTALWTGALGAKYGAGEKQDFWNIKLGDCKDCAVPEPSMLLLVTVGAVVAVRRYARGVRT